MMVIPQRMEKEMLILASLLKLIILVLRVAYDLFIMLSKRSMGYLDRLCTGCLGRLSSSPMLGLRLALGSVSE